MAAYVAELRAIAEDCNFGDFQVIREYLAREYSEGRVLGPLNPTVFPQVHSSLFGVIPKGSTASFWTCLLQKDRV